MTADINVSALVRRYAQEAHKSYTAKLDRLRGVANDRPLDLDGEHYVNFCAARALYALYDDALALDAVGNSAFNDDKVLIRTRKARTSALRWILTTRPNNGGIYGIEIRVRENAVRTFLSETVYAEEA